MARIVYDKDVPEDQRWCWSTDVPKSWGATSPSIISDRVMEVLSSANVRWNGNAPEIAVIAGEDGHRILSNADDDPSMLFAGMTEPPMTSEEMKIESAKERTAAFVASVNAGTKMNADELAAAIADLAVLHLST